MKNALINPNEKINFENQEIGERIAQVEDQTFEVALPLFWTPCDDDVVADQFYYNTTDEQIYPVPVPPEPEPV